MAHNGLNIFDWNGRHVYIRHGYLVPNSNIVRLMPLFINNNVERSSLHIALPNLEYNDQYLFKIEFLHTDSNILLQNTSIILNISAFGVSPDNSENIMESILIELFTLENGNRSSLIFIKYAYSETLTQIQETQRIENMDDKVVLILWYDNYTSNVSVKILNSNFKFERKFIINPYLIKKLKISLNNNSSSSITFKINESKPINPG